MPAERADPVGIAAQARLGRGNAERMTATAVLEFGTGIGTLRTALVFHAGDDQVFAWRDDGDPASAG